MKLRSRSVLAVMWFLLAAGVALYISLFWRNTALDLSVFDGTIKLLSVAVVGYAFAGVCVLFAALYWYSVRLDRAVLNWLHFVGTVATMLFAWLLIKLALDFGGPGSYYQYSESSTIANEMAQQQIQVLTWQFRAMVFLFAASQLMLLINLLTKPQPDPEDIVIQKMLDEL